MTCSRLVPDYFTTFKICFLQNWFSSYSQFVHDLFITCSWLVHDMCMCTTNLFMNYFNRTSKLELLHFTTLIYFNYLSKLLHLNIEQLHLNEFIWTSSLTLLDITYIPYTTSLELLYLSNLIWTTLLKVFYSKYFTWTSLITLLYFT